ncbi:MAG: histidinol-phosphate transaminase [Actinomycetota bacterium]
MTRPFEVRDDLLGVPPYRAPQVEAAVRLNTNESPWPPPDGFLKDLAERIARLELNRYPDREARALRRALGSRFTWPGDGVWVANGSNEIIQTLLLAFGGAGRRLLIFTPTYAMYPQIAAVTATGLVSREVAEPWVLDPAAVATAVGEADPAITFICSPNNPTGTVQPLDVVRAALDANRGIVVVDEAYGEFGGEAATTILGRHDRLAVVRSFSKSWRLAGARLGYLLAHPWLIEAMQIARLPYHLSTLTQTAGEVAVRHQQQILGQIAEIVAERDRLGKELERVSGVEVFPSDANFLLFRTPWDGPRLWTGLADAGVLVRDFSGMIPRALRVTVGSAEQNLTFVETLRSVLADG